MHIHRPAPSGLGVVLALLAAWFAPAAQPSGQAAPTRLSILELPLELSLRPLFDTVERQVPLQAGHWRDWQSTLGVETRYRAWRGPLSLEMQGDILTLRAHVRYWVQARAPLLGGLGPETDCGLEEAPRQALIALQARLYWGPDWRLYPRFRILPTRFLDRCELTLADIDVTPLVDNAFRSRIQQSLRRAMDSLQPAFRGLREQAGMLWQGLNRPLSLGAEAWLTLHPRAVALSPVNGEGDKARLKLALALQPVLDWGERPAERMPPLPPLQPLPPGRAGLHFDVSLQLDYGVLGAYLTRALSDQEWQVRERRFGIRSVEVSRQDGDLHLRVQLTGEAAGSAELWVTPGFDADSGELHLQSLDYVLRPDDPELYDLALMFYEQIREALKAGAARYLAQGLEQLRSRLGDALRDLAPTGLSVDMGTIDLTALDIGLGGGALILRGEAAGSLRIRSRN